VQPAVTRSAGKCVFINGPLKLQPYIISKGKPVMTTLSLANTQTHTFCS